MVDMVIFQHFIQQKKIKEEEEKMKYLCAVLFGKKCSSENIKYNLTMVTNLLFVCSSAWTPELLRVSSRFNSYN